METIIIPKQQADDRPTIQPRPNKVGPVPLSTAQQQIWLHTELAGGAPLYNMAVLLERTGRFDCSAFGRALEGLVARHDAWRAVVKMVDGQAMQEIRSPFRLSVPVVDLRPLPADTLDAEARRIAAAHVTERFDLATGPLVRALVIRVEDERHYACLALHHLIADGISVHEIALPELVEAYEALVAQRLPRNETAPVSYADFAVWQATRSERNATEDFDYWRRQLGDLPPFDLGTGHRNAEDLSGASYDFNLPADIEERLTQLGRSHGATLYVTLLAAFLVLLHRYQGHDRGLVGTVWSGRTLPELARIVGCFIRTVVVPVDMTGNPTFLELLNRVRRVTWESFKQDGVGLEDLVRELRPERNGLRPPFFQAMFTVFRDATLPAGWKVLHWTLPTGLAKFDLHLEWKPTREGLVGRFDYDTHLFQEGDVERMAAHLQVLLTDIVAHPEWRIGEIALLGNDERRLLLNEWCGRRTDYPHDSTVDQLFETQARTTPDAIALTFGDEHVSYRELDVRANRLARYLHARGVRPEDLVGVCVERSIEMVVAVLAILKAGAGYVPVDPRYPADRVRFILEDAKVAAVLTTSALLGRLEAVPAACRAIALDAEVESIASQEASALPLSMTRDRVAYVTYTSGSTGRPKGVVVPHRGVIRLVRGQDYVELSPREVLFQFAPLAFDASTFEIWGALLNGARLAICPPQLPTVDELGELLRREGVTTLWLTAPLFHEMVDLNLEGLRGVRQMLAGGDVVSPEHVRKLLAAGWDTTFTNGYGPTENTTFTACHRMRPGSTVGRSVPIGRPVANTSVYVLDRYRQPCPVGVPGELWTGGDGVARGYLNLPELTAERFVPSRTESGPPERLYRTGDRVRFLADGTLEFLGRFDNQVKIRGLRIELGEIEAALLAFPDVREAAVLAEGDRGTGKRLAAYVVPAPGLTAASLRAQLATKLPDYMVPSVIEFLDRLPRTSSGKLDRNALRGQRRGASAAEAGTPPRTQTERRLAALWEQALGVERVSREDHFFELGGDSLQAVRLFADIHRAFGRSLPLGVLFRAPTLGQLAEALERTGAEEISPLVAIQPGGSRPPFFCVHPIGGEVFCYAPLAQRLGPDQPFYGLAVHLEAMERGTPTVEWLADLYLAAVRSVRPKGPYLIGGYSFGGVVAYEMARRLREAGETVALLAAIDAWPTGRPASPARFVANAVRRLPGRLREGDVWDRLKYWGGKAALQLMGVAREEREARGWEEERRRLFKGLYRAWLDYRPGPYDGTITVFRASQVQLLAPEEPEVAWARLASEGVELHVIPGSHGKLLEGGGLEELARALDECLRSPRLSHEFRTMPRAIADGRLEEAS